MITKLRTGDKVAEIRNKALAAAYEYLNRAVPGAYMGLTTYFRNKCGMEFVDMLVSEPIKAYRILVVARALYFGYFRNYGNKHGLLPQPPHLVRWFIGGFIDRHHLGGLTGYED